MTDRRESLPRALSAATAPHRGLPGGQVAPSDDTARGGLPRDAPELGLDLVEGLRLVRRRWRLVALCTLAGTALAVGLVTLLPANYAAEALLVLDPRRSKVGELRSPMEALLSRTQSDLSAIRTETEMLTSPAVLREAVTRLGPAGGTATGAAVVPATLRGALDGLRAWLSLAASAVGRAPAPPEPDAELRLDRAVQALGRQVSASNEGGSYLMRVQAEAPEPVLAARVANAVSEVYLDQHQELQKEERDAELAWLRDRLDGLQRTVQASDAAVESYRTKNRLGRGRVASTLEERINEVNSAVTAARVRLSRLSASLAEASRALRRDSGQSAPEVLASPVVQQLRTQEAALLARRSELERSVGPRHPEILEVGAQLAVLRGRVDLEIRRIVASLQAEVTATDNEIADLTRQLGELENQRESSAGAMVELAELERRAAANREIYEQVLAEFSASVVRQAGTTTEVRLVAVARPPTEPAGPKRKLIVGGAFLASAALGALAALLIGFHRAGFASGKALERATGVPTLELVPELGRRELRRVRRAATASAAGVPAIRGLALMLQSACEAAGPRPILVLVTSAERGEGKSFCAGHLARLLASLGQRRVTLVDLDFWRPSVARMAQELRAEPTERTVDGTVVLCDPATGLEILPVDQGGAREGRAEGFARRLAAARARMADHDLVILDAPPLLPIPDVLLAAGSADATLLVVRFERTAVETVQAALQRLGSVGVRPLGTLLSRVVVRNYRRYGYREAIVPQAEA